MQLLKTQCCASRDTSAAGKHSNTLVTLRTDHCYYSGDVEEDHRLTMNGGLNQCSLSKSFVLAVVCRLQTIWISSAKAEKI